MKNRIYYFTGSGNTLKIAKDIAKALGDTELVRITSDLKVESVPGSFERVGIMAPVYKGGLPHMVRDFLSNLSISEDSYIFSILTCDAMEVNGHADICKILAKKNLKVQSIFTFIMPANNMTWRAPDPEDKQQKLFDQNARQIVDVLKIIKEKEANAYDYKNRLIRALGKRMYKKFNPHEADVNFYVEDTCISCGLCEKVCPAHNIDLRGGKPTWLHRCENCTACLQLCPNKSIQYGNKSKKWGRYHHPEIAVKELML